MINGFARRKNESFILLAVTGGGSVGELFPVVLTVPTLHQHVKTHYFQQHVSLASIPFNCASDSAFSDIARIYKFHLLTYLLLNNMGTRDNCYPPNFHL